MMLLHNPSILVTLMAFVVTVMDAYVLTKSARYLLSDQRNTMDPDVRIPTEKRNMPLSLNGVLRMLARMLSASQRRYRVDEYALLREKMTKLGKRSDESLLSKDEESYQVGNNKKKLELTKGNGVDGFPTDAENMFHISSTDDLSRGQGEEPEIGNVPQEVNTVGRLLTALREKHRTFEREREDENHSDSMGHRAPKVPNGDTGEMSQMNVDNELASIKLRMSEIAKRSKDAAVRSKAMDTKIGLVCHMIEQMIKHYEYVLEMISNQEVEIFVQPKQGSDDEIGKEAGDSLIRHQKSNDFKRNRDNIIPDDVKQLVNRMELHMLALRRLNRDFILNVSKGDPFNGINRRLAQNEKGHRVNDMKENDNINNNYPFYRASQGLAQLGKRYRADAYDMEDQKYHYVQVSELDMLPIEDVLSLFADIIAETDRRRHRMELAADTDGLY